MKHLSTLIFSAALLSGCGNGLESKVKAFSSSSTGVYECGVDCSELFEVKPNKTASIINHRQIMPSFRRCLGLGKSQISSKTKTTYKDSIIALSKDGKADSISAPMLLSITKVVAETCRDLMNVEKSSSNRKYFPGFNLGSGAGSQAFNLTNSIEKIASSCWGRNARQEEVNLVINALAGASLANSKNTKAAIFMCTTLLSSSAAVGL